MTLILQLSPEVEQKLRAAAAASGKSVDAYAVEVLAHGLEGSDHVSDHVEDIFGPLRAALHAGGLSDDEIERELDEALKESRRERRERRERGST
jgi:plasmid stability protein